eukprot:TRINITY_DN1567_c0_g1_i4.p1 TRINITY_DN1567_c0_g1~~TRINITY_DN1567_c0_g1_i4.p1  ORF type:complete len:436 (+),score=74.73 TRINITY_DN1567_c0_g1_i4:128-1309(+)
MTDYFPFVFLPNEIQAKIFSYLDFFELTLCMRVSKTWNRLIDVDSLWRRLCKKLAERYPFDTVVKPIEITWRAYYPILSVENQIRAVASELLDIVLLTCDLQWTQIIFRLDSNAPEGHRWPHLTIMSEAMKDGDPKKMTTEDMQKCLAVLGIHLPYRASLVKDIMYEIQMILESLSYVWDGTSIMLKRNTNRMDELVEISFTNNDETEIYQIVISPSFGIINQPFLERIIERASTLKRHDRLLKALLSITPTIYTDLKNGYMRFVKDDPALCFQIAFDVIGSFSKLHSTWCWSWANDSYSLSHHATVRKVRDQSRQEHWPEQNLFNTSIINCESLFAFSIAHMCAFRMKEECVLVYPLGSSDPNFPRVFLALKIPSDIHERIIAIDQQLQQQQ